ncbi:MAG TPA: hypothetical protein ENN77_02615, partial [Candidatus Wirthbacteria bacterium]|nr:hypothetical protein [Candidatus Wirthbacteria bacterium]
LILRNSGNDWPKSLFRDGFMQSLVQHLDTIETQAYRPAILFINGEYWGIHNIRERFDVDYFTNHYGLAAESLTILGKNALLEYGSSEHREEYLALRDYVAKQPVVTDDIYQLVDSQINLQSLIDLYGAHIYFGNVDWPQNNIAYWKSQEAEGKWRWLLLDTDHGFARHGELLLGNTEDFRLKYGPTSGLDFNTLAWAGDAVNYFLMDEWPNVLFNRLLTNDDFVTRLSNSMADALNSYFAPATVLGTLDTMAQAIRPEVGEHFHRYPGSLRADEKNSYFLPCTMMQELADQGRLANSQLFDLDSGRPSQQNPPADWEAEIEKMRQFAIYRPDYVRGHFVSFLGLSGIAELTVELDPQQGQVQINSLMVDSQAPGYQDGSWTGVYFQDIPITARAIPRPGYAFVGWEGLTGQGAEVEILMDGDLVIRPLFRRVE